MAASVEERNTSLKQALIESLTAILSADQNAREMGEEQIKVLEVTEEFGVHLAELTIDRQGNPSIRQLASVLLKQYVNVHWSQDADKFTAPETTEAAKAAIKQLLPSGLQDHNSKVRSSVAYAISAIAHWDWPESWPDLFGHLMTALKSGETDLVHGAMRVLTEFCREVSDKQMPQVAPLILSEMYKIFSMADLYSIRTRSRAIDIFNTCVSLVCAMREIYPEAPKQLLYPVIPQFTEAFTHALTLPDGMTSDCGLKMEALKALTILVKNFPKTMSAYLPQVLPHVWHLLTSSVDRYVKTAVNDTEDADDPVDSDGELLGFENLVFNVFDFIHALIETNKFKKTIRNFMDQLIYYIIIYMQMTEEQIQVWSENPNQYVEDEDDETYSYSIRISAQDLLMAVAAELKKESTLALAHAVTRHLQEAEIARNSGNAFWWKIHESCMCAMGTLKDLFSCKLNSGEVQFDLHGFLSQVVLADLNQSVSPFLVGQALWAASRFTLMMSPELLTQFIQAVVSGLQSDQLPAIRICSVRAMFGFCDYLKSSNNTVLLVPYLPQALDGLITMATQFNEDVLSLVLESLDIVLSIDKNLTATYESKVTPLTIALFIKYGTDPMISPCLEDLFKQISLNEGCYPTLEQRFLPTLVSLFQVQPDKSPLGITSVAMDILCSMLRNSTGPLSEPMINNVFPSVVSCVIKSDDNSILQSGGECVRAFVARGMDQILAWHDSVGNNGLNYIIQVVSHLLSPRSSEYTAMFVGRLVTSLTKKLGSGLGDNLDLMLRAVLSKLQQAETSSVIQSLVMVFIHLIHTQLQQTVDFLSSVPDPTGKSALDFVMTLWCERQPEFLGEYDAKICSLAMCSLIEHVISTGDKRLEGIIVKGERVVTQGTGIRTRSKAASQPEQWTSVPLPVKLFKMILDDLSSIMEAQELKDEDPPLSDEGDEWEDEEDDDDANLGPTVGQFLESMLMPGAFGGYGGFDRFLDGDQKQEEDDPDIKSDPVNSMDMQAYLQQFVHKLSQQPSFGAFCQTLNPSERQTMQNLGVKVG